MAATANSPVTPRRATGSWTSDRSARKLLISCAARPPEGRYLVDVENGTAAFHYQGYRAAALSAIRDRYVGEGLIGEQPTVTAAIDAAPIAVAYAAATIRLRADLMSVAAAPFQMGEAA